MEFFSLIVNKSKNKKNPDKQTNKQKNPKTLIHIIQFTGPDLTL